MSNIDKCQYYKTKNGYRSGCGFTAAYNRFWKYCPYCGKRIIVINQKYYD